MSYSPPVETFKESDGLNIDMYSDGDVLIEVTSPGFIQISAQTIRAMAAKLPKVQGGVNPIVVSPRWAPSPVQPGTTLIPASAQAVKEIPKNVRKTARGWECNLASSDGETVSYVYTSRDTARLGKIEHVVGSNGRIG